MKSFYFLYMIVSVFAQIEYWTYETELNEAADGGHKSSEGAKPK